MKQRLMVCLLLLLGACAHEDASVRCDRRLQAINAPPPGAVAAKAAARPTPGSPLP